MAKTKTQINLKLRIPRVVMDLRNADPSLLELMIPGLDHLTARFHVIGDGAEGLPHVFSLEEAIEEADIWVVFSRDLPKDFSMIIQEGIVPVMMNGVHPKAENYSAIEEKGNAFLFPRLTSWTVYGSLVRAIENFAFPHDWQNLKSHGKTLKKV
ncbi:MAG: hypothetical protein AAB802_04635 [Patescibacteria group bacterium]